MIDINMVGVNMQVVEAEGPQGPLRLLRLEDPSGIVVSVPLDIGAAISLGNALAGRGVVVPQPGLPKTRIPR